MRRYITLHFDINEPTAMAAIMQQTTEVVVDSYNSQGYADYHWEDVDGVLVQVERKQWGEILGGMDKVEEQLLRHLNGHPGSRLILLIEGVMVGSGTGSQVMKRAKGIFVKGMDYKWQRPIGVYSWLYGVAKYCEIIYTSCLEDTAVALVAMYNYDMKADHETFHRHIKIANFNPNPFVTSLMGSSPGLGDKRAQDIVKAVGTPWAWYSAGWQGQPVVKSVKDLTKIPGIGLTIVKNSLAQFGRPDV